MGSGSPAELLVTEKAELAVQENKETKERMLQLVITSLVLGSAVAAPQDYQSYLSQLHQYRMEYLPESVNSYINKTWEEGRDVAYDLYDDIKEEVLSKSDAHVDALTDMMEKFFERANEIQTMNEIDLNATGGSSDILVDEPRAN